MFVMKKNILFLILLNVAGCGIANKFSSSFAETSENNGANCFLMFMIITKNGNYTNNTQPRTWAINQYPTMQQCKEENQYRQDFNKRISFSDEQGEKVAFSECVCTND